MADRIPGTEAALQSGNPGGTAPDASRGVAEPIRQGLSVAQEGLSVAQEGLSVAQDGVLEAQRDKPSGKSS